MSRTMILLGAGFLLSAAGCRGGGGSCQPPPPEFSGMPMQGSMMMNGGCADCGTQPPLASNMGDPILTAPQRIDTPTKQEGPSYAEPMPFDPKKN